MLCTVSHAECKISQVFSAFFVLMRGCRWELCLLRAVLWSAGQGWTLVLLVLGGRNTSSAAGLSATASLYGGCAQVVLLAFLHSFSYALGISTGACQNPAREFYKVFWECSTENAREKQVITAKSLLWLKFHTGCLLQACTKKVKRFCFISLI